MVLSSLVTPISSSQLFPIRYESHYQLNYLAEPREEHDSSEGSTADEDAGPSGSGWKGSGKPMQVGIGYTVRDFCDGQSLASPGRWSPSERRYPQSDAWNAVVGLVKRFSEGFGTTKLLMDLALGRIKECPFPIEAVTSLKNEIVDGLSSRGLNLKREEGDRDELPKIPRSTPPRRAGS